MNNQSVPPEGQSSEQTGTESALHDTPCWASDSSPSTPEAEDMTRSVMSSGSDGNGEEHDAKRDADRCASAFIDWAEGKYEEWCHRWESGLKFLYQSPQLSPDAHHHWFGEVGHNASDIMRQIALQNGILKLHDALQSLIRSSSLPAETSLQLSALRQFACLQQSEPQSAHDIASPASPRALEVLGSLDQSSKGDSILPNAECMHADESTPKHL